MPAFAGMTGRMVQPAQGGSLTGGSQIEAHMVTVSLAAGGNYTITASTDFVAGDVTNPGFIVVGPDGKFVSRAWDVFDENPEVATFTAADSGTYIILVHGDLAGGEVGDVHVAVAQN